jgi:hypothetical protein
LGALHEDHYTFLIILAQFLEGEVFQTKAVEKFETHILCSRTVFFFEYHAVYENVERQYIRGEAIAYCMLGMLSLQTNNQNM